MTVLVLILDIILTLILVVDMSPPATIIGSTYEVRCTDIVENLGWKTIEKSLKSCEIMMTIKAFTGMLPNYL